MINPASKYSGQVNAIEILKDLIGRRKDEIDAWFSAASKSSPPFFYNSVDIRNAGFKIAPVDTNLFPAGFNNLSKGERVKAAGTIKSYLKLYYPAAKKILIIAEDHTRNEFYLENVHVLESILIDAGLAVKVTSLAEIEIQQGHSVKTLSGSELVVHAAKREKNLIKTLDGFTADLILINNDLTSGIPEILQGVEQPITPPIGLGWHQRRKSQHFEAYDNFVRDFSSHFKIDPWLITTYSDRCGLINFKDRTGLICLEEKIDNLIEKIQKKYDEYGITEKPFVFIKSDRGTYGLGIMTAHSSAEVRDMNKNIRKKMNVIRSGELNSEVIIQEGVPTIDNVEGRTAEPMLYLMGGNPVGCIYRTNERKNQYESLNAVGMQFSSIAEHTNDPSICSSLALVARLASYAAAWECYVESYSI